MGHGYVVAAFRVSGDSPSKGARITELLLVKLSDAGQEVARLRLPEAATQVSIEPVLQPEVFSRLAEFTGEGPVVTHDGYNWKRFLRHEFASQPKDELKQMLARTIDVSEWSQQRFPRQRKDMESLCSRLKIELPSILQGVEREAVAIRWVVPHIQQWTTRQKEALKVIARAPLRERVSPTLKPVQGPLPLRSRLRRAWAILVGSSF